MTKGNSHSEGSHYFILFWKIIKTITSSDLIECQYVIKEKKLKIYIKCDLQISSSNEDTSANHFECSDKSSS